MKYVALDFETTGLDPKVNSPLSFAAIYDNGGPLEDLPRFEYKFFWDRIVLDMAAGQINRGLINDFLSGGSGYEQKALFADKFRCWLVDQGFDPIKDRLNLAGKNPAFDAGFLKELGVNYFRYRMIDPSILYVQYEDDRLPDLTTCLKRAGHFGLKLHNAMDDALAIVLLLRGSNVFKAT